MAFEEQYLSLVRHVLKSGEEREDRTGVGTRSVFGVALECDLEREAFPLLLTRPVSWKTAIKELLWMIRGETNVRSLQEQGVRIWDQWANDEGNLGPVYGAQWREWYTCNRTIDQLSNVIAEIKTNPTSRRLIVNAWNVGQIDEMALPPCHMMFQFYVRGGGRLDCQMYQRSSDLCVGMPFNMVGYATLTTMIARECSLFPGKVRIAIGDAHVYLNHTEKAWDMIKRFKKDTYWAFDNENLAHLEYTPPEGGFFNATIDNFNVRAYEPYGDPIQWEVAV